jgi:hypothetical protein
MYCMPSLSDDKAHAAPPCAQRSLAAGGSFLAHFANSAVRQQLRQNLTHLPRTCTEQLAEQAGQTTDMAETGRSRLREVVCF